MDQKTIDKLRYSKVKRLQFENIRLKNELKYAKAKIQKCGRILKLYETNANQSSMINQSKPIALEPTELPDIKDGSTKKNVADLEAEELELPDIKDGSTNKSVADLEAEELEIFETHEAYIKETLNFEERVKHLEKELIFIEEKKDSEIQEKDKKIDFLQNTVTTLEKNIIDLQEAIAIRDCDFASSEKKRAAKGKSVRKSSNVQVGEESSSKNTGKSMIDLNDDHVKQMQILFKDKSNHGPNKDIAFHLMNQTFDKRREFIVTECPKIIKIKEMYPWLFSFEEVRNELNRIFSSKPSDFLSNVTNYSDKILSISVDPLKNKILALEDASECPNNKKHIRETGSLLLLPKLLKEDNSFLKFNDDEKRNRYKGFYPFIRVPPSCNEIMDLITKKGSYQVVVDKIDICETLTLAEALLAFCACLFIFNIQYDSKFYNTFIVIEKLFLDINESWYIPNYTKELIKMLTHATD